MNKIKQLISNSKLYFICRLFAEKVAEAFFLMPRLSSGRNNWQKLEPVLRVEIHAIEKGMSIGAVRKGFGKAKAFDLIRQLSHYITIGGRREFVVECCSILRKYIDFNTSLGADVNDFNDALIQFCKKNSINTIDFGGIKEVSLEEVYSSLNNEFTVFSQSRYAIRDFGSNRIGRDIIEKALKLSEKSPSACNRQSWKIHVFETEDKRLKLFEQQGGCRGFYQDMQYAILISGDLNYYRFYELSQVYVDGGIYAMNLMYALHYYGVATIPLTMSAKVKKLRSIMQNLSLPDNELPILLIGVGSFKDKFKVAKSERESFITYTTFE